MTTMAELAAKEDTKKSKKRKASEEGGATKKKKKKKATTSELVEDDETAKKKTAKKKKKKKTEEKALIHNKDAQQQQQTTEDSPAKKKKKAFYEEHDIRVTSEDAIEPTLSFEAAPFSAECRRLLRMAGYEAPTPTQAVSWPLVLKESDVISVAKTGSGKTLGFLLPALHRLSLMPQVKIQGPCAPRCLVLAPTRELATQIGEEASKFAPTFAARAATVYGGSPKWEQARRVKTLGGRALLVGTPGRVHDFLQERKLSLARLEVLVLDEADRMLDLGFEPQIRQILDHSTTLGRRQTLLFTATWDAKIQKVARTLMVGPRLATVFFGDSSSGKLLANEDVSQYVKVLSQPSHKRDEALRYVRDLLTTSPNFTKVIVFVATKRSCDGLANAIYDQCSELVDALHGDKEQWQRDAVIAQFKTGALQILVATDVAARGLDVSDVSHVLCYDFPSGSRGIEDYVHRIGRTGRAGNKGHATTFFTHDDAPQAPALLQILQDAHQPVPDDLLRLSQHRRSAGGGDKKTAGFFRGKSAGRGGRGRGGSFNKQQRRCSS